MCLALIIDRIYYNNVMKKTPERDKLLNWYYTRKLEGMKSCHVSTKEGGMRLTEASITELTEGMCAELSRMNEAETIPATGI